MSAFWSWYIIVITVATMAGCFWIIRWTSKHRPNEANQGDVTGHTWDDDLQEYNNPLPRWWLWLFYLTIIFSVVYLVLYPGLGSFEGKYQWTQQSQYNDEMAAADKEYAPLFAGFAKMDIPTLAKDAKAMSAGKNLYLSHCATCHGSSAQGSKGFPNLADNDWLYGGDPDTIKETILKGRPRLDLGQTGMPAMGMGMPDDMLNNIVNYVMSLSGQQVNADSANAGKPMFTAMCAGCHGPDGKGMQVTGAPNLTDNIWLYGGSAAAIKETLVKGRKGVMPAHLEILGNNEMAHYKAHVLTAYVYSLSHP